MKNLKYLLAVAVLVFSVSVSWATVMELWSSTDLTNWARVDGVSFSIGGDSLLGQTFKILADKVGLGQVSVEVWTSADSTSWTPTGAKLSLPCPDPARFYRLKILQPPPVIGPTVTVTRSGIDQNVLVGVPNQFLGQFTMVVSGEPVIYSNITFFAMTTNSLNNVVLTKSDGSVLAGPVDSISNNGSVPLIISFTDETFFPVGTNIYFIKGALSPTFTDGESFSLYDEPSWDWRDGRGQISGVPATSSPGFVYCPTVTAKRGALTVSSDASSPGYQLVSAGSVGVTANILKFRALGEDIRLQQISLWLLSGTSADIVQLTVWDGTTQVGTGEFVGTSTQAVVVLNAPIVIAQDTDKILVVKVDLSSVCSSCPVRQSGHNIILACGTFKGLAPDPNTFGTGVLSGQRFEAIGFALPDGFPSTGIRVLKSFPIFAPDPLPTYGAADGRLMRFKVTANANGPVSLYKLSFHLNPMGGTISHINLYGYTDPAYAVPITGVGAGGMVSATNFNSSTAPDAPDLSVYAQTVNGQPTVITIPAGQTYYFELRGNVMSDVNSFSCQIPGDGDDGIGFSMDTPANLEAVRQRVVIWSPNSVAISHFDDPDWTDSRAFLFMYLPMPPQMRYR